MTGDPHKAAVVRMTVTNRSSTPTDLVLEPRGEVYPMAPGTTREVLYAGDATPSLSIDVHDGELKIWEEGPGFLDLDEGEVGESG
jgi:hypothetical protein